MVPSDVNSQQIDMSNPKKLSKVELYMKGKAELGEDVVTTAMTRREIIDAVSHARAAAAHKIGINKVLSVVANAEYPLCIKLTKMSADVTLVKISFYIKGWAVQQLLDANPPVWLDRFCSPDM